MTTETDNIEADINQSRHALNDTIEALGGKLTPGQIVDEAMGLLHGQAGKFTANLGRQVRDNPLPLLLIGAGVAMLFMHKHEDTSPTLTDEDRQTDAHFAQLESARLGLVRGKDENESAWSDRLHEVEAKVLGLKQDAGEALDAFKQRVKASGETLSKTAAGIRDRIAAGYFYASHAVADGAAGAGHFVSAQAHNAKDAATGLKHKAQDLYADNPLAAGAIGVAIGALIGAAAPLSAVERDKLGGIAEAATKKGADLAERGARVAEGLADKAAAMH
jgi:hypothetical protein